MRRPLFRVLARLTVLLISAVLDGLPATDLKNRSSVIPTMDALQAQRSDS